MGTSARADGWKGAANAAMERYADGEDGAFEELYELIASPLFAFLVRQTRDKERARDLLHETFVRIHLARSHFTRHGEVMPWAFAIARRLMIDCIRKEKREVLRADDGPAEEDTAQSMEAIDFAPDAHLSAKQLAAGFTRELSRLPEPQRLAFELVRLDGLSTAEAAQVLGVTVAAVKLRVHRTYEALRHFMAEPIGGDGA